MKKYLKFVALLVCMLTLFTAPTYAYAFTLPVCVVNQPDNMSYSYEEPYVIQPTTTESLFNYSGNYNGAFYVPAGKNPAFLINVGSADTYFIEIIMAAPYYASVYTMVSRAGTYLNMPSYNFDRTFVIRITPISGPSPVLSYSYFYY